MPRSHTASFVGLALLLAAAAPRAALAGDGAREINAACIPAGCFPGDPPDATTVTIANPGKYVMTSSLSVNQNTTAIVITANDVTLDMNGFAITGPNNCDAPPCTFPGIGIGIDALGSVRVSVSGGVIRGMGNIGIRIGHAARVERMRIESNGGNGVSAGEDALVAESVLRRNTRGVSLSAGGLLRHSQISLNRTAGASVGGGGYLGNVFSGNPTHVEEGTNLGGNLCGGGLCP